MITKQYTITSSAGVHARPATNLVSSVSSFASDITLAYNGRQVNLKSIMGVLSLGIPSGAVVTVTATGEDEEQAIAKVDEVMKKEGLIDA